MGRPSSHNRETQQRTLLAQTAARLMAESGVRDFSVAKRKAAAQLGIPHSHNLPGNEEIEAALRDYQRLFQHDSQHLQLHQLRQTAQQAMRLLAPFSPRLVGPVLTGSADQHCPIQLHLFANTSEEVGIFLMEHQIPFEQGDRRFYYSRVKEEQRPLYRFIAGENSVELCVFPANGLHHPPLSPIDGRPMQRASLTQLRQLLEDD